MDADQLPDGSWPPTVKINNVVFVDKTWQDVEEVRVVNELAVYGGPDKVRSKYTPVYYYWAGNVADDIPPGVYNYRLVLELGTSDPTKNVYLNFEGPSLKLISI
jgi:hypothetical protein